MAEQSDTVPENVKTEWARVRTAYKPGPGDSIDPRKAHLTRFRSYMAALEEWQKPLVTDSVLEGTSIAGTAEQCYEKIRLLLEHGVSHIILTPLPQYVDSTIQGFGKHVLPKHVQ